MPEKFHESPLRRISREVGDPGLFPPAVHQHYEAGKPRKAQATLRAHVGKEANSARKRRQQQYVDDPYLWLEPLKKAPSLHTVNGIGTMLYGHYKPSPDGLYVATLWFVFVFLPVFPLAAYVVHKAGGNSWNFYAKAPLPPFARIWRLGFAALSLLLVGAIAFQVIWDRSHAELWVYNGFSSPVAVQVASDHYTVEPRRVLRAGDYPIGTVHVTATPQGWSKPIEELDVDLGLSSDAWLYNVAGRASLVRGWIVYGPGEPPDDRLAGTERVTAVGEVDYLFRDAPESKSVREGSNITDQVMYSAEDEVPLTVAALFTQSMVGPEAAWDMLRAELAVNPGNQEAMGLAMTLVEPGQQAQVELGELARSARPDDVEAHRLYQNLLGPEAALEARAAYAELADQNPDDPMYHYLAGRLQPDGSREAGDYFARALELDPDYAHAHLALGYNQACNGMLDDAKASYLRYAATSDEAFIQSLRPRTRLLSAMGRSGWVTEAIQLLDQGTARHGADFATAGLRASLQARTAPESVDEALEKLSLDLATSVGSPDELAQSVAVASLDAFLAAGQAGRVQELLATMDPDYDAHSIAKGRLFLAMNSGDADTLNAVLDDHAEILTMRGSTLTLLAAAAAEALGHPSAKGLTDAACAIERAGAVNPCVALEEGADLGSADALDALLSPVAFDYRGFGYAAAALLIEHDERGDRAAHDHARTQARRMLLPDESPPW